MYFYKLKLLMGQDKDTELLRKILIYVVLVGWSGSVLWKSRYVAYTRVQLASKIFHDVVRDKYVILVYCGLRWNLNCLETRGYRPPFYCKICRQAEWVEYCFPQVTGFPLHNNAFSSLSIYNKNDNFLV